MPFIRWNEHSDYLTDSVSELYRNSDFTDCVLDVEGGSIQVHKTILAACSPYFKKLLKNHHAISFIPIKDVKYKDLKLILDFIYNGEIDVHIRDVASLIKTAKVMEMTSLILSVSHCFGEDFSCYDTSIRSLNDRCSVSCTNLTRNDTKNLLEEQVSHDFTVSYMREERFNSKSQNIHLPSVGNSTTKHLNDLSEKLNKDQLKGSIPNTCDSFKEITKQDEENVNDELIPLTFVAVPPVSEINEPIEGHQDNRCCFDSVLKDPLGEYSGILDVAKDRNIKEECIFQNELQVKNEPREENDVPNSEMKEVVLKRDKLTRSCHEPTSTESNPFVSCDKESAMEINPDVVFSNTLCSEDCAAEETHDMEINFESICGISRADVKEEKISETGQCLNHIEGDDTETLESESELLKSGAQHFSTIDYQQDVKGKEHHASTSEISAPFHLQIANETPAIHGSAFLEIQLCEERKELMERTGNNSSHIANLNTKDCNNQHLVPRDSFHLDPSELRCEYGLTGKVHNHSIKKMNYSCIRCRKSFIRMYNLKAHMRTHTVRKPLQCEICKKSFNKKVHLSLHKRSHIEEKLFQCEICKRSFTHKTYLKVHIRTHTGEKRFKYDFCGKYFNQKVSLAIHIRTHSGDKPFQCEECQKSFTDKNHLTRHKRTHTGEKRFKCDFCGKSFNEKVNLTTHVRTHTGEKPYQCDFSVKSYNQKVNLTKHVRTHTGEKPYQCDFCGKSFHNKGSPTTHTRKHTGGKPFRPK